MSGPDDPNRFATLTFEGFRDLAKDGSLSKYERIGFPDSYRAGFELAIFRDILTKLPALNEQGQTIVDIGPGSSDLPAMLIQQCQACQHQLVLVDSDEMLASGCPTTWATKNCLACFRSACPAWRPLSAGLTPFSAIPCLDAPLPTRTVRFRGPSLVAPSAWGAVPARRRPEHHDAQRFFASETGLRHHQAYSGSNDRPEVRFISWNRATSTMQSFWGWFSGRDLPDSSLHRPPISGPADGKPSRRSALRAPLSEPNDATCQKTCDYWRQRIRRSPRYFEKWSPHQVAAFAVEPAFLKRELLLGRPVISLDEMLSRFSPDNHMVFVAVIYTQLNRLRARLAETAKVMGYQLASFISPHAFVAPSARLGEHCFVFENNVNQSFVEIRSNVVLWSGNHIGHHSTIADNVFVSSHVVCQAFAKSELTRFLELTLSIANNIIVAEDCWVGPGVVIARDTVAGELYRSPEAQVAKVSALKFFRVK